MLKNNMKRTITAKELALLTGKSERTIRNHVAQNRKCYEAEAKERRLRAYTMRSSGFSINDIANTLGCSYNAAAALIKRYKQLDNKGNIL